MPDALLEPPRSPAPPPAAPPRLDPDRPPAVLPRMTREEYLAFDNAATTGEFKYEWVDGKVRAMTGGTWNHGIVGTNLTTTLSELLRAARTAGRKSLAVAGSDLRIRVPGGPYYYPDAKACPLPPQIEESDDEEQRTLLNPVFIGEVLSRSTARIDRGEKRRNYLRIPSVETYLIVQPSVREALRLTRNGDRWGEKRFRDADIELPRLGVTLRADRVWEHVLPGERVR